jgi:alkylation response protein AidB-like acyl-CoA dehydrogenase
MTPDDLAVVRRSWEQLGEHRARFAAHFTAALAARRGPAVGPAHARRLLDAADELVDLLATPSRLAAHVRATVAAWGPGATTPTVDVDGAAWIEAARRSAPGWSAAEETAWRRAWVLLADVLAADTLTPFAGDVSGTVVRSPRPGGCVPVPDVPGPLEAHRRQRNGAPPTTPAPHDHDHDELADLQRRGADMTAVLDPITTDPTDLERELVAEAAACGPVLAANAERHDRDGTWVADSFEHVKDRGLLAIAVPVELGGRGATLRQVSMVQRELARHCASTALASAMHQHVTTFTAWRYRRGLPGAEATLRRVGGEGIVLVSTGGADWTSPHGTAVKVDGGYVVNGRKVFASQSPAGTVMSTMFTYQDPERGLRVLNLAVPMADEHVTVLDTWDTLGMRGTASNDIAVEGAFVPDERVLADRPHGVVDPPLQVIATIGFGVISGVYLGVAEGAFGHAVAAVGEAGDRADDPIVQRQVGLMAHRLRVAAWALDGALATAGDDPTPSMPTVAAVMAAKREIAVAGVEVCDIAMSVAGGSAFFKGSPIERAYRDIRAAAFHPFTPEQTLVHAGRLQLGLPTDQG